MPPKNQFEHSLLPIETAEPAESVEQERNEEWEVINRYLSELSGIESLSGWEDDVEDYLKAKAEELGIEFKVDEGRNLWLLSDKPEKNILLCAHMDKVGKARAATVKGDTVTGRLDDAFGISVIMGLLEKGHRPTVLFTVEEEMAVSRVPVGAESASWDMIQKLIDTPDLALILDVSKLNKGGDGPLVYTESGGVRFPIKPLEKLNDIFASNGVKANFVPGMSNDSAWFGDVPKLGVATLQVHVDNMHSPEEAAKISDIMEAAKALEAIIKEHQEFSGLVT